MKRIATVLAALAVFSFSLACSSKADPATGVTVEPGKSAVSASSQESKADADAKSAAAAKSDAVTQPESSAKPTEVQVTETVAPAAPGADGKSAGDVKTTETKVVAPADAKVTVKAQDQKSAK